MSDNYVTCDLAGGLGNQMFMIAHAYAKSLEYNKRFVIPEKSNAGYCGLEHRLQNIYRKFDAIECLPKNGIYNPPELNLVNLPVIYSGYFQGEKYFKKYSNIIKSAFSCTEEYADKIFKNYPQLSSSSVTSIHIRRGDYLYYKKIHPTLSKEYISEVIKLVPETEYLFVSSDDIGWCKQNIDGKNLIFLEELNPHEQVWTMQMCHNFIISNSTFSWWGAYLSNNPNKRVLAPSIWFGPDGPKNWEDMYCTNWEIIPTIYNDGLLFKL